MAAGAFPANKAMKIKVSIVEDDFGTRENLLKVLQSAPELICLHGYPDGETALREHHRFGEAAEIETRDRFHEL